MPAPFPSPVEISAVALPIGLQVNPIKTESICSLGDGPESADLSKLPSRLNLDAQSLLNIQINNSPVKVTRIWSKVEGRKNRHKPASSGWSGKRKSLRGEQQLRSIWRRYLTPPTLTDLTAGRSRQNRFFLPTCLLSTRLESPLLRYELIFALLSCVACVMSNT